MKTKTNGHKLKVFRAGKLLTCEEMAERLGYTRAHISAVENELVPFSHKLKLRIKQVFRIAL